MSVPVQDSLPDLADKPASDPLEPERTELANGVRADVHLGWLTGTVSVFRRLAEIRARSSCSGSKDGVPDRGHERTSATLRLSPGGEYASSVFDAPSLLQDRPGLRQTPLAQGTRVQRGRGGHFGTP